MKAVNCPQFDSQQEFYVICPASRQSSESSKSKTDLGFIGGMILTVLVWTVIGALLESSDRYERYKQSIFISPENTVMISGIYFDYSKNE
jgi:hypothetical protein